ncbi:TPA: autotransporter outer membrane beta-barrel domain-containing protein [Escherichia coli]
MNKLYKVIWSSTHACWVVVSELGKSQKKVKLIALTALVTSLSVNASTICSSSDDDACFINDDKTINSKIETSSSILIGYQAPGNTPVTVTVTDSGMLKTEKLLRVGDGRTSAKLNIANGGSVVVDYRTIKVDSNSEINVTGENSRLIALNGNMGAGISIDYGGSINISDKGQFIGKDSDFYISGENSVSSLTITDQGSRIFANSIQLQDNALFEIGNNAEVNVNYINIGSLLESESGNKVFIGSKNYDSPIAPGVINAKTIAFDYNSGELIFNHTGNDLSIYSDIKDNKADGKGKITAANGTTILSGDNKYFSGETNILENGHIVITNNLGSSHIYNNGRLSLQATDDMQFDNKISGSGLLAVTSGNVSVGGNNSNFTGKLVVFDGATALISEQSNIGDAAIQADGKLQLDSNQDWEFTNVLTGHGTLTAKTNQNIFSFKDSALTAGFTGNLELLNSRFDLSGTNTNALTSVGLIAGNDSFVTVGMGNQSIGSLAFAGGTLNFGHIQPGQTRSDNHITADNRLDLTGNGIVQVDNTGVIDNTSQKINHALSLLEQDDENAAIQLVSVSGSGKVTGSAGGLQLQDQTGKFITDSVQHAVIQNGQKVAEGTYDYRLTSGTNNDGLYIGYGLTQLDLLTSGTDALVFDANGKTGNAADMSARITGTGDLAFNSQKGETVSLSNQNNDYTGVTDIRGGNVLMNSNNALGQTSEIRLAADTMLDMNSHSQTAGKLNGAADSVLNINGGNLTLTAGGVSAGILSGSGALNVSGGVLDITGANSTFTASTTIAKDAVVRMNDVSGLGTGNISNVGTLSLTHASGSLGNNLSGTGTVSLLSSDTQLSGNNSGYSGLFVVDESSQLTASATENLGTASVNNSGTLVLNSATGWQLTNDVSGSGTVRKTGSGSLTVGNNAVWTGQTDIDAGTLILGKTDSPVMLASSQVNITENGTLSGYGGVAGNVTNSGTLDLRADAPGNVLTVGGNYTGNNGTLLMNTVLGDDTSATDKLVIKGDASGQTRVAVTHAGGTGAQTLNGIELIHVDGNADSAEFVQAGRIAAGAYDYTLGRGQGSNSGNWYLTSGKNTPEPTPTPDPDSKPEPAPGGYDNDLRPEAGSYTANMAAVNTMFVTRLHERLGPMQYTDIMTGETKNTSMWMRHEGGHNRWRDGTGQLKTQGNRYVVQLGGDIAQWGWGETDRWHLGVMAGYGNEHNNTDSVRTGYRSKGSVNGYSTGLYATWFANDETHNGAYLDTWAQYGWFDNHVKGDGLPGESWKSKGLTASLETGYTWKAGEFSGSHGSLNEWYVQPQAQVVWMGVKADEHRESNGTRVESTGDGNVRTRLGVKTWIKGHNRMDDGKSREFRPFVEVNWLHNTREFGTRMNGVTVHQDGARNIGEVKAGVEGQINTHLNLWSNVGVQAGDKGYSDTSAMLGVKYTF